MKTEMYALLLILVIAGVTFLIRALPFLLFQGRTPSWLQYLGGVLPYAVMAMLVVYCFKNVSFLKGNHGLPEGISAIIVLLLHKWKHQTLLSILGGTLCYMGLIQFVF